MNDLLEPSIDDIELTQLQARQLELRRRQLDLAKRFGLLYYYPYPKQDAFHRAGRSKHRLYRAGNRSGKSTMGAAEDCSWLLGYRPFFAKGDPARTDGIPQHANKGLVITNDWDKVDEIWTSHETGKIWKYLPDGFVTSAVKNHAAAIDTIICANGSVLRFDTVESFKRSPYGSESSDWDFLHIDEPCPRDMYVANARGLIDRGGSDWFTLTPLTELWINDMFFPENPKDILPSAWCEIGSTYDNPYLTKAGIAEFEALITEDERQCRMNGLPLELAGLVYKEFKKDTHRTQNPPCRRRSKEPASPEPATLSKSTLSPLLHPNPTMPLPLNPSPPQIQFPSNPPCPSPSTPPPRKSSFLAITRPLTARGRKSVAPHHDRHCRPNVRVDSPRSGRNRGRRTRLSPVENTYPQFPV